MPTEPTNVTVADPNATPQTNPPTVSVTPETWEAWLEGQDEKVKGLYQAHSEKLLNTVKSTRDERDDFKKQLKELSKKATDGSELKQQLDEAVLKLEKTERRAAFMEEANKAEIQCRNPRAAWIVAEAADLFDKKGNPDWAAIKREAPELFGVVTANANAGQGTQQPPNPHKSMNDFIRTAAGRKG